MLRHVYRAKPLDDYNLRLTFDDGVEGVVDIARYLSPFRGVFEPLKDEEYFRRVYVHPELLVVTWPNGADLDSDALYEAVVEAAHDSLAEPAF